MGAAERVASSLFSVVAIHTMSQCLLSWHVLEHSGPLLAALLL